jgi:hypothetical protein
VVTYARKVHKMGFEPGSIVPDSGIYKCDAADTHESTNVKGNRFPPMPHSCKGSSWVLKVKTK